MGMGIQEVEWIGDGISAYPGVGLSLAGIGNAWE
jgi:hypothetical protein